MVHLLIFLRLVAALFVSPPPSPSDDGESPPPSPQHQRPSPLFSRCRRHHRRNSCGCLLTNPRHTITMRILSGQALQTTRTAKLASKLVGSAITDVLRAARAAALIRPLGYKFLTARLTASRACMAKKILLFHGKRILTGPPVRLLPLPHINRDSSRSIMSGLRMTGRRM
jgi:hypothetical protein